MNQRLVDIFEQFTYTGKVLGRPGAVWEAGGQSPGEPELGRRQQAQPPRQQEHI
jgi:hypothetical protein